MDIAEFLLARIAEDEAKAQEIRAFTDRAAVARLSDHGTGVLLGEVVVFDPARVLAECEAKRRIVELHKPWHGSYECPTCADGASEDHGEVVVDRLRAPCPTLRLLAPPYADHPDYQPVWSPLAVV